MNKNKKSKYSLKLLLAEIFLARGPVGNDALGEYKKHRDKYKLPKEFYFYIGTAIVIALIMMYVIK